MSRPVIAVLCLLLLLPLSAAADPVDDVVAKSGAELPFCDSFDSRRCLLPWPSDVFTTADASTPTGLRVDLPLAGMPRNVAGRPIDPTEQNRNDGFSPGSTMMTLVPGLDMAATFGVENTIVDPAASLAADSPVVVVDAATGERHPVWAELDTHPGTAPADQLLIIRPLRNLEHATRYVVGLRGMQDASGPIAAPAAFADAVAAGAERLTDVLPVLADAGVDADELYLAWDFTVASAENVTGRALAIRDDAFAQLGDTDLSDLQIPEDSTAPDFSITRVTTDLGNDVRFRRVEGTVTVPNYMTTPQGTEVPPSRPAQTQAIPSNPFTDGYDELAGLGQHVPAYRLNYASPTPGPMDTPVQNPVAPTLEADFTCVIPSPALTGGEPATGMLYGHGLLGTRSEVTGGSADRMREQGFATCGVDWAGMSTPDVLNVATLLTDMPNFASLPDRAQQGFLNFMYIGRALVHPEGMTTDPAFQLTDGTPLVHTSATSGDEPYLTYDGNSQGGIMGGALVALSPDITRGSLGVVGMNYSTLLNRSVDWEGHGTDIEPGELPAYASVMYTAYPDKIDQQIVFQVIQMLWDRGETNGYAHFVGTPLPNSPANQLLLHPAFGDYQVANVSAEVAARTMGARLMTNALEPGLHWSVDPAFGFDPVGEGCEGCSALVYWDSGNPVPPNGNVPPASLGKDPHEHPRRDVLSGAQRAAFMRTGRVVDVHAGGPYRTPNFPVHGFLADGVTAARPGQNS